MPAPKPPGLLADRTDTMKLSVESFQAVVAFIGNSRSSGQGEDRRRLPRTDILTGRVSIRILHKGQPEEDVQVAVRDVSPEGIGITHAQPLRMGDQFILHLPSESGQGRASRDILCTVTRWWPDGPTFNIGAVFSRDMTTGFNIETIVVAVVGALIVLVAFNALF